MGRSKNCRRVRCLPDVNYFKPGGVPLSSLEESVLLVDELEAIRLADLEGLYQEDAAQYMNVSRQTFGKIIKSAHNKVAEALVNGKALRIEGGEIEMSEMRKFECLDCNQRWEIPFGTGRPMACPSCKSLNTHRSPSDRGYSRTGKLRKRMLRQGGHRSGQESQR